MSHFENHLSSNLKSKEVKEHLGSNLKVQSITGGFSTIYSILMDSRYTEMVLYALGCAACLFLSFLPWYSWFIGFFSIPVAIIDIVLVYIFNGNSDLLWV